MAEYGVAGCASRVLNLANAEITERENEVGVATDNQKRAEALYRRDYSTGVVGRLFSPHGEATRVYAGLVEPANEKLLDATRRLSEARTLASIAKGQAQGAAINMPSATCERATAARDDKVRGALRRAESAASDAARIGTTHPDELTTLQGAQEIEDQGEALNRGSTFWDNIFDRRLQSRYW